MSTLLVRHDTRVEVSLPADLSVVYVNPDVLRQIFLCLLTAIVQEGHSWELDVDGVNSGSAVEIRIMVRGSGQAHPPASVVEDRIAPLLSAARRLAEPQGASIGVVNSPGEALGLTVRLPAEPMTRVLVVDDNPDLVHLFRRFLAGGSYRLIQARTLPAAIAFAREYRPDVVILDVMIPGRDGWQILEQLRTDPIIRGVPVVVCSILPEESLARSLGVLEFLAKPVSRESLIGVLERCRNKRCLPEHRG